MWHCGRALSARCLRLHPQEREKVKGGGMEKEREEERRMEKRKEDRKGTKINEGRGREWEEKSRK